MVITLCFIAIVSRAIIISSCIYYLFSSDYIATLSGTLVDLVVVFGPAVSFFVFHRFNSKFRKEFMIMIGFLKRKQSNSNNVACKSITTLYINKYMWENEATISINKSFIVNSIHMVFRNIKFNYRRKSRFINFDI